MKVRIAVSLGCVVLLLSGAAAYAHHSFASEYDVDRRVELQGTVTRFALINPHAWIHIDVKREDGSVEKWRIETGAPNGDVPLAVEI